MRKIKVGSENDKSKSYLVQILDDGKTICECKDWQFRSKNDLWYRCKHISRAIKHINKEKILLLEDDIKYEVMDYEISKESPTDTAQFRRALSNQAQKIENMKDKLAKLKG